MKNNLVCSKCNMANCIGHFDSDFKCDCGGDGSGFHHYSCNKLIKVFVLKPNLEVNNDKVPV